MRQDQAYDPSKTRVEAQDYSQARGLGYNSGRADLRIRHDQFYEYRDD